MKVYLKIKNYKIKNCQKGIAALVTILSLGTLVFTVSLATTVLAFWGIKNMDINKKMLESYYAAYSGIQDSLIKLERNKDFSRNFNLSINASDDVSVLVSNIGDSATITSTAVFGQVNKKLQTITDIDSTTGLITPTSTTELTL